MGRCNARVDSLRELESKESAPVTQVKVVWFIFKLSGLVLVTAFVATFILFSLPTKTTWDGVEEWACLTAMKLRGWGLGSIGDGFRNDLIAIILAVVPMGLTISGMTWVARKRPAKVLYHAEWLQDVIDTEKREWVAYFLLSLSAYVCGAALLMFWLDVLLQCRPSSDFLVALFLTVTYLFAATLPKLMKVGENASISGYAQKLLVLRRIAKWRYFHGVSPRCDGFGESFRSGRREMGHKFKFWLSFIIIIISSCLPGAALWGSLSIHHLGRPELPEYVSLAAIIMGWLALWGGASVIVFSPAAWVKVPKTKSEPNWRWYIFFVMISFGLLGGFFQAAGYRVLFGRWLPAIISVVASNVILEVLIWRTLRDKQKFSLWLFVLERVAVMQRDLAKTTAPQKGDIEDYRAVNDLIVPKELVLDGKDLKLRDFINEMMAFDGVRGAENRQ